MGGDDDKLIRIPGESLSIKVSSEEEAYRKKYLPDAKKLTDEKLVCTVCSISLAQNIHKGKDVYIHRALQVLVCEACYNFYGDGCFSADEDGDDKYCRWCGQGGTLYLCSACNCAFCQKCTKQNLKASVLAELEKDDWKCYICNPRPLFGCRTICWGAQQLNKIGKEKEHERAAKIKERLEKLEAKRKEQAVERKSRKAFSSEDDALTEALTKKRKKDSDGDSSSPEVIPKRRKRESRVKSEGKSLNGSIGRRRKDSSPDSESEGEKKTTRHSRTNNTKEKIVQSSSEDESGSRNKRDKIKKKKKYKEDSDDSSDAGKKKPKRRSVKKKDSSDDSSEDEKSKKKKRLSVKKRDDSTDSSSNEKKKKKKPKKKKNYTSSEESSVETKKKTKKISKKKTPSSSDKSSDEDEPPKSARKTKNKSGKEENVKKQETADSDNEQRKIKKADSEEVNTNSAEDILVKKRIKLAILWLSTIVKDISELGTLISLRATKFSKKKINTENLKSYEDVLNCVSKIKQLVSGVHSNYDHIEKTLDSHLKPWKILTGLEDADNEKNVDGDNNMSIDGDVSKADTSAVQHENNDTSRDVNGTLEESKVESIAEKKEETLNNWSDDSDDQTETKALISKANEALDKSQIEDEQSETGEKSTKDKSSEDTKIDDESIPEKESNPDDDGKESKGKSKTTKRDPVTPDGEPKLETAKKNLSKEKDAKINSEKSSKSKKDAESNSENDRSPKNSSPLKKDSDGEKSGEKLEAESEEVSKGEIESEG